MPAATLEPPETTMAESAKSPRCAYDGDDDAQAAQIRESIREASKQAQRLSEKANLAQWAMIAILGFSTTSLLGWLLSGGSVGVALACAVGAAAIAGTYAFLKRSEAHDINVDNGFKSARFNARTFAREIAQEIAASFGENRKTCDPAREDCLILQPASGPIPTAHIEGLPRPPQTKPLPGTEVHEPVRDDRALAAAQGHLVAR